MSGPPRWESEGRGWPNRATSRFFRTGNLTWHVQQAGSGPDVVLIHGTGAATHSWRTILPDLAKQFRVTAFDLPGHGFTTGQVRGGPTLENVSGAIAALLGVLEIAPAALVGHSAGAAIALQLAQGGSTPVIGFAPALMPFPGLAARLFPAMAKVLFVNPFVPSLFARTVRHSRDFAGFVERSTGSRIDAEGLRCYAALLGNSEHCAGALAMMANWDLPAFVDRLPTMAGRVALIHGERDSAVPVKAAREAAALLPQAMLEIVPGLGHLAHEERPDLAVAAITRLLADRAIVG